jgi:hypothetical protein
MGYAANRVMQTGNDILTFLRDNGASLTPNGQQLTATVRSAMTAVSEIVDAAKNNTTTGVSSLASGVGILTSGVKNKSIVISNKTLEKLKTANTELNTFIIKMKQKKFDLFKSKPKKTTIRTQILQSTLNPADHSLNVSINPPHENGQSVDQLLHGIIKGDDTITWSNKQNFEQKNANPKKKPKRTTVKSKIRKSKLDPEKQSVEVEIAPRENSQGADQWLNEIKTNTAPTVLWSNEQILTQDPTL